MLIYEMDVFIEFPYLTKHLYNQFKLTTAYCMKLTE